MIHVCFAQKEKLWITLLITCSYAPWQWNARFHHFKKPVPSVSEVWYVISKMKGTQKKKCFEIVLCANFWCIWLERNRVCFQHSITISGRSLAAYFISHFNFWVNGKDVFSTKIRWFQLLMRASRVSRNKIPGLAGTSTGGTDAGS